MILHQSTMKELTPLLAAALVLCVAAVCADRRRQRFWGRSLGIRLLPLFVILGLVRGFCEARSVLAEQKLALEEKYAYGVGEICGITEKEKWTVLLLKQVQTEEGDLRYLQVYVERAGKFDETKVMWTEAEKDSQSRSDTGLENVEYSQRDAETDQGKDSQIQSAYRIGNVVRVWGEFSQFQTASNPGEFDYAAYYRGQKLVWRMFALSVQNVKASGKLDAFSNEMLRFRAWASARLKLLAGEEDGSIFAAMLLGDKTSMSEEIRDLYQKNGIAHLLAVSGLHLSLISMAAYGMLRKAGAGYGRAAVMGGLVLIGYSLLTGASPSVIRALIMTLCGFLAAYLGRTYDLLSAMGLSAFLLLWHSPYLVDQAGVQLSFAAIGGIGLAKELEAWTEIETDCLAESARAGKVKAGKRTESETVGGYSGGQTLRLTLCMQLVSLPVILWHFFSYPLYGIFLNLLVVPLTGIIVGSGAGGILVSLAAIRAGVFLTGSGRAVLAWYEFCCRWFMKLPGSSFLHGRPELWQIVVYYVALGVLVYLVCEKGKHEEELKQCVSEMGERTVQPDSALAFPSGICRMARGKLEMMLVCFLLMALIFLRAPVVRGLEVTILDTGQGDGICIRTKNEVILVDGGSTDQKELGKYRLEPFLKSKGIRQVDLAIVTHGDWDHISGLSWLMEQAAENAAGASSGNIRIQTLALPEPGKGEEVYERLQELCENQGGQVVWIARGDEIGQETKDGKESFTSFPAIRKYLGGLTGGNAQNVLHLLCLYPKDVSEDGTFASDSDRNEHSLVLRLDYGTFHMLLTGDMSAKGEANLIAMEEETVRNSGKSQNGSKSDGTEEIWVLKVAHHGSAYSSSEEFLAWLSPDYAVISCGKKNRYGHPHPDTIERLTDCKSEILQTKESGAIIWNTDGHRTTWKGWKKALQK